MASLFELADGFIAQGHVGTVRPEVGEEEEANVFGLNDGSDSEDRNDGNDDADWIRFKATQFDSVQELMDSYL